MRIREVCGLEYKGSLLGIRVKYNGHYPADIPIEYIKGLKVDYLEKLELIESGDKLVTKNESTLGVVEEIGNNKEAIEEVLSFLRGSDLNYLSSSVRDKKIKEYSRQYNGLINTKWIREFIAYSTFNEEFKKNMYHGLDKAQLETVTRFSVWMSKGIIGENPNRFELKVSKSRSKMMDTAMSDQDWEYEGVVDTGAMGGGKCSLGHSLRYAHYALGKPSGQKVVFGVKCVSDFFDLDPEFIKVMGAVQERVSREIKSILFMKYTGKADIEHNKVPQVELDSPAGKLEKEFIKYGLPIPRYLRDACYKDHIYKSRKKEVYPTYDKPKSVQEMMTKLCEWSATGKIPADDFVFKVIETVTKTNKVSEKQEEIIKNSYNRYSKKAMGIK